jgi:ATP-dependent Clp protease ATP-binding subunit ClpC
LDEIKRSGDIILFIDEMHNIIGAGAAEGAIDASSILKPLLARGELQCIGATTLDEYRKYIEKDAALERRFQPVMVSEPSVDETIAILKGLRDRYEAHHKVKYTDEALETAARLSDRYVSDRFLPDKAIDLIDEAGSRVRMKASEAPDELRALDEKIAELAQEKEAAVARQEFEKAAEFRDKGTGTAQAPRGEEEGLADQGHPGEVTGYRRRHCQHCLGLDRDTREEAGSRRV